MKIAIYPGSFDPLTCGHLDLVAKVSPVFDTVIVAILHNPKKQPLFSMEERMEMIRSAVTPFTNVTVDSFAGLLMTYAETKGAVAVVRGLRDTGDFDSEFRMAHMNRHLNPTITTLFVPTNPGLSFISSSLVKEVAALRGDLTGFVPDGVRTALERKFDSAMP